MLRDLFLAFFLALSFAVTTANADSEANIQRSRNSLRRLDFIVIGKACTACLLDMQNRIAHTPGVLKAAVMLRAPFGALVIYDGRKTRTAEIIKAARGNLTNISFKKLKDDPIDHPPLVLIPLNH